MVRFDFDIVKSKEHMAELFGLTREHRLLASTFYGSAYYSEDFIKLMEDAQLYILMCDEELVGYSWLNMFSGRSAAVHVCLFPTAPKPIRARLGSAFLKYLFSMKDNKGRNCFDSLVGLVPETHKHVEIFALSIGMNYQCIIPSGMTVMGEVVDLAILTVTREDLTEE